MSIEDSSRFWSELSRDKIVTGIERISLDLVYKYIPPISRDGGVLQEIGEFGSGRGELANDLAKTQQYFVHTLDINKALSVESQEQLNIEHHVGDATLWGDGLKDPLEIVERWRGIIIEALLPSMLGNNGMQWKSLLDVADIFTGPEGHIIINDFFLADRYYGPLFSKISFEDYKKSVFSWKMRYRNNQIAFQDEGIPPNAFIVGKPGTEGKLLEWGSPDDLKKLSLSNDFERLAQHVDRFEVMRYLRLLGYSICEIQDNLYYSRGNKDIMNPSAIIVAKKGPIFKFHPVAEGFNINDPWWPKQAAYYLKNWQKVKNFPQETIDQVLTRFLSKLAPVSQREHVVARMANS